MELSDGALGMVANSCGSRSPKQVLKVIWVGPAAGGLGWLLERIRQFRSSVVDRIELRIASLDTDGDRRQLLEAGADRLIFAANTRLDYPHEAIQWLSAHAPELPFSLATDSWWDGARRTGLGVFCHLAFPWHRWWDGWVDWLEASSADLFGPLVPPPTFGLEMRPGRRAEAQGMQGGRPSRGWVIAQCAQTSAAWSLVAQQAGAVVERRDAVHVLEPDGAPVDWLLWDDSCLVTCGVSDDVEQGANWIAMARRVFPSSPIYCACSIPRWSVWEKWQHAGANELLTKPNTGRGLQQLLNRNDGWDW